MTGSLSYYRTINILSLDIAAGAVIGALFFARLFDVTILPYGLAALAITVWIIYTADHLRDAYAIRQRAATARHAFHQRHFTVLCWLVALAVIADLALIFFIRRAVFIGGIFLFGMVGLYLLLQAKLYFLKEMVVALLYTAGIILPSVVVSGETLSMVQILFIIQFALIALLNLLMFAWFDYESDRQHGQGSFVTRFGKSFSEQFIWALLWLAVALGILQTVLCSASLSGIIPLLMTLVLLWIFYRREFFRHHDYYRLAGDAIFFLPILAGL